MKTFSFLVVKFSINLNRRVFVMHFTRKQMRQHFLQDFPAKTQIILRIHDLFPLEDALALAPWLTTECPAKTQIMVQLFKASLA